MKKIKTIVCGSSFGQFYMEALQLLPEEFEFVGLLANGSERSKKCAQYHGIALYTDSSEVPAEVELACVVLRSGVLGGKGTEVSLALLERGIHVIHEQPIHHKDMALCLKKTNEKKVVFSTGNLYVHLPAVKRFIACAKALVEKQKILYVDAAFASQVSYPMIHILLEVLPSIRPWQTKAACNVDGPFQVLTGTLGKIPVIFRVNNEVNPNDPDNYLRLLHNVVIGSEAGNLCLSDTHGDVIWRPRLHVPNNLSMMSDIATTEVDYLLENSNEVLWSSPPASYRKILSQYWPNAIKQDLLNMKQMINGQSNIMMKIQQELLCSRQWQEISSAFGYPFLRPGASHQPLAASIFKEVVAKIPDEPFIEKKRLADEGKTDLLTCTEFADQELGAIDANKIKLFVARIKEAVFSVIIHTLQKQGVLLDTEKGQSKADVLATLDLLARHEYLVTRWLELLMENNYIKRKDNLYYGCNLVTEKTVKDAWKAVREVWDNKLGSPLTMDYIVQNAENLTQLMNGQIDPTWLMFPEGKMDYANSCYRDVLARYLNKTMAEAVIRISNIQKLENPDKKRLRIVEIGAGTGATTDEVLPRLREKVQDLELSYLFTDVSNYFVVAARNKYQDYPWMKYQIVDIDTEFQEQNLGSNSTEIIIAAGVIDNSYDLEKTLNGLMKVLVPGGWLIMTEPIVDFPQMLISQGFMRPVDDREITETIFRPTKVWQEMFKKIGAAEVILLPEEGHPLEPMGQKLFIIRNSLVE
ncbi:MULTISPECIES: bifunctional Gfo/Idh/MocA family oxidoreductase/class I SAM-dependent methyltransferase [Sporomusa]|jgi:thiazolinyl imide reductase|uniref:bifunctional Gfo/Idh/MocA family oxidoreductase/class I SAM-dependent methyltransferase n=1 Tax=Sporomusa TaxID=2375 RepID=UPI00202FCE18|nr:bifunctional Gfo/Idh/MocA family oxidoreductase/class I SAM-dependent methyltransferase [Sporomusa sphaeroides]MCM0760870.1 bifunctional Gfo/Idh/MocA family oxidoreductase/class I SAM-dependent methyltransferase [Sporomusa sphaeroides DSM 2875]HML33603.1 bifunctional Gfo/Idh/MocA family oxidoreductase/class I SAM-dependent methyltransferase [Sporomusa sphaeroides]